MPLLWLVGAASIGATPIGQTWQVVRDELGRNLRVAVPVQRVVVLAPSAAETLFALGACHQVVAMTTYTACPRQLAPCRRVGDPLNPSLEAVVAAQPGLVVASRSINRRETVTALERMGLPVFVTDEHTIADILETTRRLGALLGMQDAAARLTQQLRQRLQAVHARLRGWPPRRVLFVVWADPLITAGSHTFIADALRWAGAVPAVAVREDWPHVSLEQVVVAQPDYLIFPARHGESAAELLAALRQRAGWRELTALARGRVLLVDEAINRPSPQIVGVIEQLARALHPEAFAGLPPAPPQGETGPCDR